MSGSEMSSPTEPSEDPVCKNLLAVFEEDSQDASSSQKAKTTESETRSKSRREPMKVFLRIRPFTGDEIKTAQDQGCLDVVNEKTILLSAPRDSFTFKSSIRGIAEQTHQFSFSHVYGDSVSQKYFFDDTMLGLVKDFINGQNCLIFTYGVTNSGKTYTIQGTPKDGGILPRSLDVLFNSINGKQYMNSDLKPTMFQDVMIINKEQQHYEKTLKGAVMNAGEKENVDLYELLKMNTTCKSDISSITNSTSDLSSVHNITGYESENSLAEEMKNRVTDETVVDVEAQGPIKFGVWVSYAEIYNEYVYDLLDPTPTGKGKKRAVLKLGDDKNGNPYIKGLKEIQVNSADEAFKVLRVGQKNRNIAATKLNQYSSRSHSIFNIKVLRVVDVDQPHVARMSRLSFVDLAGSERYTNTQSNGERLKEASNINTSIMTLGKCIGYLRYNQLHPNHPMIIPFRESKLTRLFQGFFLGKGKACMIVNVSQCASVFDETYNVLKFSAIAKQITTKTSRPTDLFKVPQLPKPDLSSVNSTSSNASCRTVQWINGGMTTPRTISRDFLESSFADEDERSQQLVKMYEDLRGKYMELQREKAIMELKIREEVCTEMSEQLIEIERNYNERLMEEQQAIEEQCDKRIELLTKSVKKSRKRKKVERLQTDDDEYVSSVLLHAEKVKVKERDEVVMTLRAKVAELERKHDFLKQTHTPEQHSKIIERLQSELEEARETLKIQACHIEELETTLNEAGEAYQDKEIENEKLREAFSDDEERAKEQEKAIEELKTLLEKTTNELDAARKKLDIRDQRIKRLEEKLLTEAGGPNDTTLADFQKDLDRYEEQTIMAREKSAQQSEEINQLRKENEDHSRKNLALNDKMEELHRLLKESEERRENLQFEKDEFQIKRARYEEIIENHRNVLEDSDKLIEQLNKQITDVNSELEVLKQNSVKCDSSLKEELIHSQTLVKKYEEKIKSLEEEIESESNSFRVKERSVEGLNEEVLSMRTELESLRTKCNEKEGTEASLDNFQKRIKELEDEIKVKDSEISSISNILIEKDMEIKKSNGKIDELLSEIEKKSQHFDESKKTNELQILDSRRLITEKEDDVERLNRKMTEMKSQIESLEAQGNVETMKVLEKSLKEFRCKAVESEERIKHQDEKIKSQQEKLDTLRDCQSKVNEYQEKIKFLEETISSKEEKIRLLERLKEAESMPKTPTRPKPGNCDLMRNSPVRSPSSPSTSRTNVQLIKKLEKCLEDTTKSLEKKNNQVITKNNKIKQLEQSMTELEKQLKLKEAGSGKSEAIKLKEEIKGLHASINETTERKNYLEELCKEQERSINSMKDDLEFVKEQLKQKIIKLNEVHRTVDTEKEEYERKLQNLESELALLQERLTKNEEQRLLLESDCIRLKNESHRVSEERDNLQKSLKETTEKLDTMTLQLKELEKQIKEKELQLTNAHSAVKSLENKLHLKVDELESQKDRNEKVLSEMETLKTTINDLRDNQNKIQDVNEKDTALLYKRLQDLDSLALTRNQEIDKLHAALDKEKCVVQEKQDTIQDLKDKIYNLKEETRHLKDKMTKIQTEQEAQDTAHQAKVSMLESDSKKEKKAIAELRLAVVDNERVINCQEKLIEDKVCENEQLMADIKQLKDSVEEFERLIAHGNKEQRKLNSIVAEKEAENKNIERKSQQLEDEITVLKEKILCLQKEKEETFSNLNEAKHWVEDIDLSQTLEAERSKFIIEITKKDNEIKQVLEEKNKAVLALQEGYDIMKCKNDEIQRKLKEAEDQHAINLKKLTDEAKEEAKRELRKEFEEMKSETVRQNYADKENNEIVTESEDDFSTPYPQNKQKTARRRSSEIPLAEVAEYLSSTKKKKANAEETSQKSTAKATRTSSAKTKRTSKRSTVTTENGNSGKKKKTPGRQVLFDIDENNLPESKAEPTTAEKPKKEEPKKRRKRLYSKSTSVFDVTSDSPQVIPPSPVKDEVQNIVRRQLRSRR